LAQLNTWDYSVVLCVTKRCYWV